MELDISSNINTGDIQVPNVTSRLWQKQLFLQDLSMLSSSVPTNSQGGGPGTQKALNTRLLGETAHTKSRPGLSP